METIFSSYTNIVDWISVFFFKKINYKNLSLVWSKFYFFLYTFINYIFCNVVSMFNNNLYPQRCILFDLGCKV